MARDIDVVMTLIINDKFILSKHKVCILFRVDV